MAEEGDKKADRKDNDNVNNKDNNNSSSSETAITFGPQIDIR